MKAMVCTEPGKYSVEDVTLDPPKAGEIRVKMGATGVCHSDLSVINGVLPLPPPLVLGHEGAGVVEELGQGVTGLEVGDHVVLSFVPCCGTCNNCRHQRRSSVPPAYPTARCWTAPTAFTWTARTSAPCSSSAAWPRPASCPPALP